MGIKRVGSTFGFYTKKRIYVLQFKIKEFMDITKT